MRGSTTPIHVGTEETHTQSNVDEVLICTNPEAQREEVLNMFLKKYGGCVEEVDMEDARNGSQVRNDDEEKRLCVQVKS